ncbi:MAG: glycoside hydrolase family 88 protein [Acidobacteriaceae bacterium]|nr:glycoside hydrolase family 88 protein [Acidobacteriaceae bacterium]
MKTMKWMGTVLLATVSVPVFAQETLPAKPMTALAIAAAAGDQDADASGPAKLSSKLNHADVQRAMKLVADWQLKQSEGKWNQDWTYAPLYLGLLAASETTKDSRYHDVVLSKSEEFQWKLWNNRPLHADDEAIAQAYELLWHEKHDDVRIAEARSRFDQIVVYQDKPEKELWWWADSLYMAPAGLAEMSRITDDPKYKVAMDREWALTQAHFYNTDDHLFTRDARTLSTKEKNGKPVYWARGNGWVLAGTANVLQALPKNDPLRPKYEKLFREMSARIAGLQMSDGLWRTGLLDQEAYALPETSASGFFVYAMAWGVNAGVLDAKTYKPVVEKGWAGLLKHVYASGRLGCVQPIGFAPGQFETSSSYVYGTGAFLLAGSQVDRMVGTKKHAH